MNKLTLQTIPQIGMGTWGMGGRTERDESNIDASLTALRFGFDLGIRLVDVSEFYGSGLTEEIVGMALEGKPRDEFFVVSKAWKTHLHHDDLISAAKQSTVRLKSSYIDLYMIHWPNPEVPLRETMAAMEELLREGIIRAIGVSNFTPELIAEAGGYLTNAKIEAAEFEYNLVVRDAERAMIPYCRSEHIAMIAYRPLARGALVHRADRIVDELAKKYLKTKDQIVLNWLIAQDVIPIPGSIDITHIKENFGAVGWRMEDEDVRRLGALA